MMVPVSAKILLFATLRKKYGAKSLTVKCDGSARNLIKNASKILGSSFLDDVLDSEHDKIRRDIIFMINGRNIKDLKGKIEIKDGDEIAIFPPLAGG